MTTGAELRDQGIEAVIAADVAVHRSAGTFIRHAIEDLAHSGHEFTADDVRGVLADNPKVVTALREHPNLMPSFFAHASRSGLIEAVGLYRPSRSSRRASRNLVWRGK